MKHLELTDNIVRVDENGYPVTFEARNLVENQKYEFWVTASTAVGEGEPTTVSHIFLLCYACLKLSTSYRL